MYFQNKQLQGGDYREDHRAEWRVKISVWQSYRRADVCWWAGDLGFNSQRKLICGNERSSVLAVILVESAHPEIQLLLCEVAGRHQLIPFLAYCWWRDLSKNPLGNRDGIQREARKSSEMGFMGPSNWGVGKGGRNVPKFLRWHF